MKKKKRVELFGEEIKLWKAEKELSKAENLTAEQLTESNERLLKAFKDLIDQSKLSTRISEMALIFLGLKYFIPKTVFYHTYFFYQIFILFE